MSKREAAGPHRPTTQRAPAPLSRAPPSRPAAAAAGGRGGNGFLCQAGDLVSRNKAGRQFLTLDEGDAPLRPWLYRSGPTTVVCLAGTGERLRLLVFGSDELKALKNGGRGSSLVDLDKGEVLLQAMLCGSDGLVLAGQGRAGKPMERSVSLRELGDYRGARGRKGKVLEPRWKDPILATPRPTPPKPAV
jgi:topoisomerase-4 subunit A